MDSSRESVRWSARKSTLSASGSEDEDEDELEFAQEVQTVTAVPRGGLPDYSALPPAEDSPANASLQTIQSGVEMMQDSPLASEVGSPLTTRLATEPATAPAADRRLTYGLVIGVAAGLLSVVAQLWSLFADYEQRDRGRFASVDSKQPEL